MTGRSVASSVRSSLAEGTVSRSRGSVAKAFAQLAGDVSNRRHQRLVNVRRCLRLFALGERANGEYRPHPRAKVFGRELGFGRLLQVGIDFGRFDGVGFARTLLALGTHLATLSKTRSRCGCASACSWSEPGAEMKLEPACYVAPLE